MYDIINYSYYNMLYLLSNYILYIAPQKYNNSTKNLLFDKFNLFLCSTNIN